MEFRENILKWYEPYMMFMGLIGNALFILQIIRILQTHSSHDVSLAGFLISTISVYSWLIYGYLTHDKVLLRVNIIGTVLSTVCLVVILRFR